MPWTSLQPAVSRRNIVQPTDSCSSRGWVGILRKKDLSITLPSKKHTNSLFLISPPVATLIRLLLQWWGWFIYLFFEGHWEEPWRRQWHPTPVLLPGESHGLRSLVGCRLRVGTQLTDFTFTFHFHALGKEMATHSSVLAWRIPGTGEPGGLPSMGSHRVGHDWSDLAAAAAAAVARKGEGLFIEFKNQLSCVLSLLESYTKE